MKRTFTTMTEKITKEPRNVRRNPHNKWSSINKLIKPEKYNIQTKGYEPYKLTDNDKTTWMWVSPSSVSNYLIGDPMLDWLKLKYPDVRYTDFTKRLFELGNLFEEQIFKEMDKRMANDSEYSSVLVCHDIKNINREQFNDTVNHITNKIPVIKQAVLYNDNNLTRGVADLLIRSDYINKIFDETILNDCEIYHEGDVFYYVVDIKWTTIKLLKDNKSISSIGRIPCYKGQLALYNLALGEIQGHIPMYSFLLGRAYKYKQNNIETNIYDAFHTLGRFYWNGRDNMTLGKLKEAIKWVRTVRLNYDDWDYPQPCVPELYPNMCNRYDDPYHKIKKEIAHNIEEITILWQITTHHRKIAFDHNIYKWSDCDTNLLDIDGYTKSNIENIIAANKINIKDADDISYCVPNRLIMPKIDSDNIFFVDFETINTLFFHDNTYNKITDEYIFMIGVGHIVNNKKTGAQWTYECFVMSDLSDRSELINIDTFVDYIRLKGGDNAKIMHWGHAELSMLNKSNKRHKNKYTNWIDQIEWFDMNKFFVKNKIGIYNAFSYGLKDIGNAMYKNNMIQTIWVDDCDGMDAIIMACDYYKTNNLNILEKIITYNEIDCKILCDILEYVNNKLIY